MSTKSEHSREADRLPAGTAAPGGTLDLSPLVGTWWNTNTESRGMVRIEVAAEDESLAVRVFGAGSPEPIDWGSVLATPYAKSVDSAEAMAWSALYDFGFLRVELQTNIKQGVLVVASFNEFLDQSGRSSYFTREFFYL